ncbi:MAG: hypothetical protein ACP5I1_12060 [Candidatus Hinthialibacter sp.]
MNNGKNLHSNLFIDRLIWMTHQSAACSRQQKSLDFIVSVPACGVGVMIISEEHLFPFRTETEKPRFNEEKPARGKNGKIEKKLLTEPEI